MGNWFEKWYSDFKKSPDYKMACKILEFNAEKIKGMTDDEILKYAEDNCKDIQILEMAIGRPIDTSDYWEFPNWTTKEISTDTFFSELIFNEYRWFKNDNYHFSKENSHIFFLKDEDKVKFLINNDFAIELNSSELIALMQICRENDFSAHSLDKYNKYNSNEKECDWEILDWRYPDRRDAQNERIDYLISQKKPPYYFSERTFLSFENWNENIGLVNTIFSNVLDNNIKIRLYHPVDATEIFFSKDDFELKIDFEIIVACVQRLRELKYSKPLRQYNNFYRYDWKL